MSKGTAPPYSQSPPPYAPPSYSTAVGGVAPQSPYTPNIQTTHIVTTVVPLGPASTHMICPSCQAEVNTKTKSTPSLKAYLCGIFLCCIGCDLGCCLIPCCMDSCMDVEHKCPNCNGFLGKYAE